jgi:hypothetical protein
MASAGLLALLDDVAALAKLAAKKTAGISADDMALNSKALVGIEPKRELPIIGKVALGSVANKVVLIPAALGLSAVAPWSITPLMMLGGAFLCYEGVEKILHARKHKNDDVIEKEAVAVLSSKELEKQKVKSAIKTDFILSAEIIVVALGAMTTAALLPKAAALAVVGFGMTAAIYGAVAGLVKMDDIGLHMMEKQGTGFLAKTQRKCGKALVETAPRLLKGISFLGTAAMFTVGGGILVHGIPAAHHALEAGIQALTQNGVVAGALEMAATGLVGVVAGAVAVPAIHMVSKPAHKAFGAVRKIFTGDKQQQAAQAAPDHAPEPVVTSNLAQPGALAAEMNDITAKPAQSIPAPAPAPAPAPQPPRMS